MPKTKTLALCLIFLLFLLGLVYFFFPKESQAIPSYRVAYDKTWYPLHLFDLEDDITILSQELTRAIADEQHLPTVIFNVGSENLFEGLDNGEYDGILSSALSIFRETDSYSDETDKYAMSDIYYPLGPVLVVSSASNIQGVEDLAGKDIGIISQSKPVVSLFRNSSVNLIFYDYNNLIQLMDDVSNNKIDGMILNMIPAYEFAHSSIYHNKLKIVSEPLTHVGLRLIASKSNPQGNALISEFNKGLSALKKNGTYGRLLTELGLFNPDKLTN